MHYFSQISLTFNNVKAIVVASMFFAILFTSCTEKEKKYVIGISQCSEDAWREKLHREITMTTYFMENVEIRYACAYDNADKQVEQIDSLVKSGIDLLVVSPEQMKPITPVLDKVYDKGIPVILFDRKTDSDKYTAFIGADNYIIGEILGQYVADKLNGNGNIVEIKGLKSSSPAIERSRGFSSVIKKYPGLKIVASGDTKWTAESGEEAIKKILTEYHGEIDCVFGANDRIAVAVRDVLQKQGYGHSGILYVGVDALPGKDGGMQQVKDGILDASVEYPTHGDEIIALAMDILEGRDFSKESMLNTILVTKANAKVLLQQNIQIEKQFSYLEQMHQRVDKTVQQIDIQKVILNTFIVIIIIICVLLVIIITAYRQKKTLNKNLAKEKEKVERQRDELEEQRDKFIEATIRNSNLSEDKRGDIDNESSENPEKFQTEERQFLYKFDNLVLENMSNSDLSIEQIGEMIGFSRIQLYRKVKALSGLSPVEYVRKKRLATARTLLSETSLSVSEVAYKVGFSSPSYFAKCYKDEYGINPTSAQKK